MPVSKETVDATGVHIAHEVTQGYPLHIRLMNTECHPEALMLRVTVEHGKLKVHRQ